MTTAATRTAILSKVFLASDPRTPWEGGVVPDLSASFTPSSVRPFRSKGHCGCLAPAGQLSPGHRHRPTHRNPLPLPFDRDAIPLHALFAAAGDAHENRKRTGEEPRPETEKKAGLAQGDDQKHGGDWLRQGLAGAVSDLLRLHQGL